MNARTVALVGVLALASGWMLGGRYGTLAPDPGAAAPSQGPRPLGLESPPRSMPLTDQLRQRLDRRTPSPRPTRNPFVFGERPPARMTSSSTPVEAAPEHVDAAPRAEAAPRPAFAYALSGIASSETDGAPEFTAILSGTYGLLFARAGDALPGGFVVVDVQETIVTLRDAAGSERTLSLR